MSARSPIAWRRWKRELVHDSDEVWPEYCDPGRHPWSTQVQPVLKQVPSKQLAEETGLAVNTVTVARNEHTNPHGRNCQARIGAADRTAVHG